MIVKLPTLGLVCPFPLVEAKEAMAKLNKGDGLEIEFDCTQATEAIPAWAAEEGYLITVIDHFASSICSKFVTS